MSELPLTDAPPRRLPGRREAEGHGAMLLFSALVAGSFSLGGRVADLVDPVAFTALRFWLAALVIAVAVRATGPLRRPRAVWLLHKSAFLYHRKHGAHGPLNLYSLLVLAGLALRALAKLVTSLLARG